MVLSKFQWTPEIGNSRQPIPSKAIEGLTLKYSLMNLSNRLLINLLTMSMDLRRCLFQRSLSFVIEWRKSLAAICNTLLMLDRLKFGIISSLILTMKLSHCSTSSVVGLWRSAECRCFKKKSWGLWIIVSNNWGFTNEKKIRKLRTCMMSNSNLSSKMYLLRHLDENAITISQVEGQ